MRRLLVTAALLGTAACTRDLSVPSIDPGTVYGRVLYSQAGNNDRLAAAGATVEVLGTGLYAVASDSGQFLLTGITHSSGTLLFRFDENGNGAYSRQKLIPLADIHAGRGRQISLGDVLVSQNARMRGRVLRADHAADPGGHGGSVVYVPEGPFTTYTNDDGTFTLNELPEGEIRVSIFRPNYLAVTVDHVDLRSGEDFALKEVQLQLDNSPAQPGSIGGKVALLPASSYSDVAAVAVSTFGTTVNTTVDDQGAFVFDPLSPDLYTLIISKPGYAAAVVPNVLLTAGKQVVVADIVLAQGETRDAGTTSNADAGTGARAPTASAGLPGAVAPNRTYRLDGSASVNPQGGVLSYFWEQLPGGPVVTLTPNNSVLASRPTFMAPEGGEAKLTFKLTVTNAAGLTSTATTWVDIIREPVAMVTPSRLTLNTSQSGTLDASGSYDPNGATLTYAWSVLTGGISLATTTGPQVTVTVAPSAVGPAAVRLVVSNGFVLSDPLDIPVDIGVAATLTAYAGPHRYVGLGATVVLQGSGSSTNPNETLSYAWQQLSGTPVTLFNANQDACSFTAPVSVGELGFQLTVSSASVPGGVTSNVTVSVRDLAPPIIIAREPAVSGGPGSPMLLTATFNKDLDAYTVTPTTVALRDSANALVPSEISYHAASRTVRLVPSVPLQTGGSYQFVVGAVHDTTELSLVHTSETFPFLARGLQWRLWTSAQSTNATPPRPGVAASSTETFVFAYGTHGGCVNATWLMQPGISDGGTVLADDPYCVGLNAGAQPSRKAIVAGDTIYAMTSVNTVNGGPGHFIRRNGTGWFPHTSGPYPFSDGVNVYGHGENYGMHFYAFSVGTNSWSDEYSESTFGGTYTYDYSTMNGTGGDGRIVATGTRYNGAGFRVVARERTGAGWVTLAGTADAQGAIAYVGGNYPSRPAWVKHEPFVTYGELSGFTRVSGAAWSSALQAWTLYPNLSAGVSTSFDAVGRGDTVYLAAVLGTDLHLRRLNLSAPSPVVEDVLGPAGLSLNQGASCTADHPELFNANDALWLTWAETCGPSNHFVYLYRID